MTFLILRAKSLCLLKNWLSNYCPRESIFHDSNWKVTSLHNHWRDEQMLQRDMLHPLNPSTSDHQYLHEIIYSCGSCLHVCNWSSLCLQSWLPINYFDHKSSLFLDWESCFQRLSTSDPFAYQRDHLSKFHHPLRVDHSIPYKSNPVRWLATLHNQIYSML